MRTSLLLVGVVVTSNALVAAEIKAKNIIAKSEAAYATLKSYEGTTTVREKVEFTNGKKKTDLMATATITFVRPGKIRIEGKDFESQPYAVVSDGNSTWVTLPKSGAFQKAVSLEKAFWMNTGTALGAPTAIPAALMKLNWRDAPFAQAHTGVPKLIRREAVDGADCYTIVVDSDKYKRTYWIDNANFLMHRMKEEQSEKQSAAMAAEFMKRRGKSKDTPLWIWKSSEVVHSFKIDKVNGTPDAKQFADPTKK